MTRRLLSLILLAVFGVLAYADPAAAHNSLSSSEPADGAVLDVAPRQIVMTFAKPVPLETMTVELIDPTGVRSQVTTLGHGSTGDTEVVVTLPVLANGASTVRWQLVGPDGHPITGRVRLTVTAAPTQLVPATTAPIGSAAPPPSSAPQVIADTEADNGGSTSTPSGVRWLIRFVSYVAIAAVLGILAASALIWPGAAAHRRLRSLQGRALWVITGLAVAQLLIVASDITGDPPWSALGGLSGAFKTFAGVGFAVRALLAVGLLALMSLARRGGDEQAAARASMVVAVLILATWAWAGHARSMRWPLIGVPLDIVHHAAAAAWLGGIAVLGVVAIRDAPERELVRAVQRFAAYAPWAVGALAVTGLIQAVRLVGNPLRVMDADHGRYLVIKLVFVVVMLKIADLNRRRVARRFQGVEVVGSKALALLRRSLGTELVVGLLILAITAAMVVSPPASADSSGGRPSASPLPTTASSAPVARPPTSTVASPASTVAPAAKQCTISPPLRLGATGAGVTCLQRALITQGLLAGAPTNTFDDATDRAVRAFQRANDLAIDGVVGPITAAALGVAPASP